MTVGSASGSRAVIRAHQERVLIERWRLFIWGMIAVVVGLWGLKASGLVTHATSEVPFLNSIELCVLIVALTQLRRPWCRRHVLGLLVAFSVQIVAFLALYGLWTGDLWLVSVWLGTLSLVTAAVFPWGVAAQGVVVAASSLGFASVHWSLNGTLDDPLTIRTLVQFALSLLIAFWLKQAHADIATEIERRQTAESGLQQATASAKVAVWDADLRTLKVHFASGWNRLLGRDANELMLADLWDLVHPEDRARTTSAMQEHLQGRASAYETEQRMLHADGSYRWVLSRGVVAYGAEGQPNRLLGADIDITDRKRLEEALQDIEARKHVEKVLRESEERYRGHFEQAAIGIAFAGLDGRYLRVNQRLCDIVGYTEPELCTRRFQDITHPGDLDRDLSAMRDMLDGKIQTHSIEKRYFRKDGSIVWVDLAVSLIRDPSGHPKYFVSVVEDIDARKRAEEALRASEKKFQGLFESSRDAIMTLEPPSWRFTSGNPATVKMFEAKNEEEFISRGPWELSPDRQPDGRASVEKAQEMIETAMREGSHFFEWTHRRIGGEEFPADVLLTRMEQWGKVILQATVRDITARKQAESERERLFLFLDSIVENIPDMVFVKDAKSLEYVLFNRAGAELLGYRRPDLIGKNDYDLFPKEEANFFTEKDRAALHNKALLDIPEEPIKTAQHGERILHTKKIPLLDDKGEAAYLLGISEDITDRQHAEQMQRRHDRETTVVNDILRAINTHLDVKAAFPEVGAGLRELARCAAVSLNLFDERREWLTFVAADAPWALGASQDVHLRAAELPAVTDMLAGRPHIVRDLATELQFPLVQVVYEIGFRSVVALPLCVGSDVVGILNLFWREVDGWESGEMGTLTQVANAVAIAVEKNRLFEQVSAGRERLAVLSRRLMEVQEAERRHLARELHDEIGQYLTGVNLVVGTVEHLSVEGAVARLKEVRALVEDLIVRVRDVSLDLRPAMLDDLGLLPALLWLFGHFSKQTNVEIEFRHSGLNRRFQHEVETAAYRIVQEALTNVARHAGVSKARVHVSADHRLLSVMIADHGKGFDPDAVLGAGATGGFLGMRERASFAGGHLSVESGVGTGTRVRAEFQSTGSGVLGPG
jgi:PAS domain S-box-containing protein